MTQLSLLNSSQPLPPPPAGQWAPPVGDPDTVAHAILRERFGFQEFRTGQLDVIRSILERRDAMAVMPTGRGKSLCYQIPALAFDGIVIVVSPLISLMKDQVQALKRAGIAAGALHTGQDMDEKREIFSALRRERRFVLYVSPERVQKDGFAQWIASQRVSLFAIDEAHCVSSWGPEFRQDYHKLDLLRKLKPEVPILALTATATPMVLNDIARQLDLKRPDRHVHGFYRENLYVQVESCENEARKTAFVKEALMRVPEGRVIIYCGTRKQCEETASDLKTLFGEVAFYHAGMKPEDRARVQTDYDSGKSRVLCATNAFGMGIDHPDVRLVVHFQMPANVESYYQEMGRAGRDGKPSACLLLYSKKDRALHTYFIRQSTSTDEGGENHTRQRWRALDAITQFAEGGECRHSGILTYFRDSKRIDRCGHCDVCAPDDPRRSPEPRVAAVAFPKSKKRSSSSSSSSREKHATSSVPLEGKALLREEVLREWRKVYAQNLDVPAFMIFSNKTLHALALHDPSSIEELHEIYGLGPQKIETFGKTLLEELEKCR